MVKANDSNSSWKDVSDAVKAAKDREDGQDKDSWSARDSCDKIVDNISAFETWLDLLPGGDYGAVIGGVFKMVVTVWAAIPGTLGRKLTLTGCKTRPRCSSNHLPGAGRYTLLGWTCE